ncbi:dTDP-4-dehydrorhamnose 3,5-epimerase family protein [Salinibacterium sp. ZJ70]|uniref:dTDP-4-dehydrorhamnose 3,5-epimerase family protein n=1 Tax=Salinibacterium sp. ZJ70 TaxID=2708084 RepID=UPI0014218687|nr:dTDP-4-dehydrorhamnose 3,5-epimerase [Salinibacterium sp. ZJ70]
MEIRPLGIAGAYELTPRQWEDDRGVFLEWYRGDLLDEQFGVGIGLRQANTSVSKRGVLRGVHYADVPPGQAKHVTATRGAALDIIVDIRVGSPTFGRVESVLLDTVDRRAVYLAEGLGHAFIALEDDTTVSYLVSSTFSPGREHGISPLDPALGLELPIDLAEVIVSEKDRQAPTLAEALAAGALPLWEDVRTYAGREWRD